MPLKVNKWGQSPLFNIFKWDQSPLFNIFAFPLLATGVEREWGQSPLFNILTTRSQTNSEWGQQLSLKNIFKKR